MTTRLYYATLKQTDIIIEAREKDDEKIKEALDFDSMLHAFLYTQTGIPVLYSGDEIGQFNDYTYHQDPLKQEDSRYLHRGDLDWKAVEKRADEFTYQGKLFQSIQKLTKLRAKYGVFNGNADTWIVETYNDSVLGIGRYYNGEKLIALFNFSKNDEIAWIDEAEEYVDLISGISKIAKEVKMPAQSFVWLYHNSITQYS
ncbi:MAG: hypothetical protein MJ134_08395 [Lachnospiraceae bacterium]|nr:hypothetical protein [Lachnospiraceae bacterium]